MSYSKLLKIYYSAAFINIIGVLFLSKGFTNQTLIQTDATLFSRFGLCMIILWGFCYFVCAPAAHQYPSISIVFAMEKLVYLVMWIHFIQGPVQWSTLYEQDLFAGIFYSIYGLIDGVFMLLFVYSAHYASKKPF